MSLISGTASRKMPSMPWVKSSLAIPHPWQPPLNRRWTTEPSMVTRSARPGGQGADQGNRRPLDERPSLLGPRARGVRIDQDESTRSTRIGGHIEPGPAQPVDARLWDDDREG